MNKGTRNKVGFSKVLLHTILTFMTGGVWLVVLLVRACLR